MCLVLVQGRWRNMLKPLTNISQMPTVGGLARPHASARLVPATHDACLHPHTPSPCDRAVRVPLPCGSERHGCQERVPRPSGLVATALTLVPEGSAGPSRCASHAPPAAEKRTPYATLALTRVRLDPFGPTTPPTPPRPAALVRRAWSARAWPPPRRLVGDPPLVPQVRARGDGSLPGTAPRAALRGDRSRGSLGGAALGGPHPLGGGRHTIGAYLSI